ncbi:MAG: hypothetical protein ACM3N7_01385, partial [Planctomycetaceae bacterium]
MDSSFESIGGSEIKETLKDLVLSGQMCKVEISRTTYSWLTPLSEIRENGEGISLLVDQIPDFEKALCAP